MCILDSGRVTIPVASLMEEGSKSKWCSPGGQTWGNICAELEGAKEKVKVLSHQYRYSLPDATLVKSNSGKGGIYFLITIFTL